MTEHASSGPRNFALVDLHFDDIFTFFCGAKIYSSGPNYGKNYL